MYLKFLKRPAVWYTDAVTRTINFVSIRRETVFINRVRVSAPASSSPEERENEILSVRHGLWTKLWLPRIEAPTQKFTDKEQAKENLLGSQLFAMGAAQPLYQPSGAGSPSS